MIVDDSDKYVYINYTITFDKDAFVKIYDDFESYKNQSKFKQCWKLWNLVLDIGTITNNLPDENKLVRKIRRCGMDYVYYINLEDLKLTGQSEIQFFYEF